MPFAPSGQRQTEIQFVMLVAFVTAAVNSLLIYAFSSQLASNYFFNTTRFTSVYSLALMFTGQGIGSAAAAFLFQRYNLARIRILLVSWTVIIAGTFIFILRVYPDIMRDLHEAIEAERVGHWAKIVFIGGVQLPTFFVEGVIFALVFGHVRASMSERIPQLVAVSVLGATLGYLMGVVIPDYPGLNAVFVPLALMPLAIIFVPNYLGSAAVAAVLIGAGALNLDAALERFRDLDNEPHLIETGSEMLDYDWSRFQRSVYMKYSRGDQEQMRLTFNGAFQVMAGGQELSRNLFYDLIYNPDNVRGKDLLIIGCGMGRSLELAIENGARHIRAVDIEPSLLAKYDLYKPYNNAVFDHPDVDFTVDDGRYILHSSREKYDLIVVEGVQNLQASRTLSITTEGYLFTPEAILDALELLTEDGVYVIIGHAATHATHSLLHYYPELESEYHMNLAHTRFENRVEGVSEAEARWVDRYGAPLLVISRNPAPVEQLATLAPLEAYRDRITSHEQRSLKVKNLRWPLSDNRPYPFIRDQGKVSTFSNLAMVAGVLAVIMLFLGRFTVGAGLSHGWFLLLGFSMMFGQMLVIHRLGFFMGDTMLSFSFGIIVFLLFFATGNYFSERLRLSAWVFCLLWALSCAWFLYLFGYGVRAGVAELVYGLGTSFWVSALKIGVLAVAFGPLAFLMGTFFPRLIVQYVAADRATAQLGWAMLLDSLGVCVGFFLFTYIAVNTGLTQTIPIFVVSYMILSLAVYTRRAAA